MLQGVGADHPGPSVADAVPHVKLGDVDETLPRFAVAEAQHAAQIVVYVDDEVPIELGTREQVRDRHPRRGRADRSQADGRTGLAKVAAEIHGSAQRGKAGCAVRLALERQRSLRQAERERVHAVRRFVAGFVVRLVFDRAPVIGQRDVAARDRHTPDGRDADDGREADRDGKGVGGAPRDFDERQQLVDRHGRRHRLGIEGRIERGQEQRIVHRVGRRSRRADRRIRVDALDAHDLAVRRIGIGGAAGRRTEQFFQEQIIAGL